MMFIYLVLKSGKYYRMKSMPRMGVADTRLVYGDTAGGGHVEVFRDNVEAIETYPDSVTAAARRRELDARYERGNGSVTV